MAYQAILFDLDGTLLPMANDTFIQAYFGLLAKAAEPWGYAPEALVKGLWAGVAAMVENDGSRTNEAVFWQTFSGIFGRRVYEDIPKFDAFYRTEFSKARAVIGTDPGAAEAVRLARQKAERVILATNPQFPPAATENRMGWVGLRPEDFDLVTTYDNCSFSKPNPQYYRQILERFGLSPERCLMVGNDVEEDIVPARSLGMDTYFVTDYRVCKGLCQDTWQGRFPQLLDFLARL